MEHPRVNRFVVAALLLLSPRAWGQSSTLQPVGVAYYALQSFSDGQCTRALSVFNGVETPSMAILWGTFGTSRKCLKRYLSTYANTPHILEVHITNNTCLRTGICRQGEVIRGVSPRRYNQLLEDRDPTTIRLLRERINTIARSIRVLRGPAARILLSTGLEDNYSPRAYQTVKSLLAQALRITHFEIVRSPMRVRTKTAILSDLIEGHGRAPPIGSEWNGRCVVSNDGINIQFSGNPRRGEIYWTDLASFIDPYKNRSCLVQLWWAGPQGLGESRITPRRRRYILRPDALEKINRVLLSY